AMLAGFRDGGDHAGSFHRLQLLELIVEGAITLGRHRHFFHCVVSFLLRPKTDERRFGASRPRGASRDRPKKVGRPALKLKMGETGRWTLFVAAEQRKARVARPLFA